MGLYASLCVEESGLCGWKLKMRLDLRQHVQKSTTFCQYNPSKYPFDFASHGYLASHSVFKEAFKFCASVVWQREWIKRHTSHSTINELKRALFVPCFIRARAGSYPLQRRGVFVIKLGFNNCGNSSNNILLFACELYFKTNCLSAMGF